MNRSIQPALATFILALSSSTQAAQLILNEYNAVSSSNYLNGGDAFMDDDGNIPPPADPFFGRVAGNGGDWFELVVVADHLDVRGWQLAITDNGVSQPALSFTVHPLWADLRAGTIITVSEEVNDDPSYDPDSGDWWINVRAADPGGGSGQYITASNFPVSNDNWQLQILDRDGGVVFGPAGEGIVDDHGVPVDIGVNSKEMFSLDGTPSALVEPFSSFYTDGIASSFGQPNPLGLGTVQDFSALRLGLPVPDRDGDGIADDGDHSGIVGDATCVGGNTASCDDNCPTQRDATQADAGGLGAGSHPDGIGDACQCGDVDNNGVLTQNDVMLIATGAVQSPEKCSVTGGSECNIDDATALGQALLGNPGAISQVCSAAVVPEDDSDLVYDPDRVLEISVTMNAADWQALRNETWTWADRLAFPDCGIAPWPSPFNWYMADITIDSQSFVSIGIRKKGFVGSLSTIKPALKVELDRNIAGQELNGVTRFTFNNAKEDPSLVRQCLSFDFFRSAGIPAPRCNFAHIVVNGEDLGVYANVETVKEPFLARNFPDPTGKLWEGVVSDLWPGSWSGTFEPETDAAEDDRTELDAAAVALNQLSGQALLDEVGRYVDLDQFIHYWAAEAVIAHIDGYHHNGNNYFVYVDPTVGRLQFFPWDADKDFSPPNATIFEARMALARKLYNISSTRAQYLGEVQELLDTVWNPSTYVNEIARMRALLAPVLVASGMLQELRDMLDDQVRLRTWINRHDAVVRNQLAQAPPFLSDMQVEHPCDMDVAQGVTSFVSVRREYVTRD